MLHHGASQSLSPLNEMDRHSSSSLRARKMSSTGGNRSWSEEEVSSIQTPLWDDCNHTNVKIHRRTICFKHACRRCLISILQHILRRPSWPAAFTITNCLTEATAENERLLYRPPPPPPRQASPPTALNIQSIWTTMITLLLKHPDTVRLSAMIAAPPVATTLSVLLPIATNTRSFCPSRDL